MSQTDLLERLVLALAAAWAILPPLAHLTALAVDAWREPGPARPTGRFFELLPLWRSKTPPGDAWACPNCGQLAGDGPAAVRHASAELHGFPRLVDAGSDDGAWWELSGAPAEALVEALRAAVRENGRPCSPPAEKTLTPEELRGLAMGGALSRADLRRLFVENGVFASDAEMFGEQPPVFVPEHVRFPTPLGPVGASWRAVNQGRGRPGGANASDDAPDHARECRECDQIPAGVPWICTSGGCPLPLSRFGMVGEREIHSIGRDLVLEALKLPGELGIVRDGLDEVARALRESDVGVGLLESFEAVRSLAEWRPFDRVEPAVGRYILRTAMQRRFDGTEAPMVGCAVVELAEGDGWDECRERGEVWRYI